MLIILIDDENDVMLDILMIDDHNIVMLITLIDDENNVMLTILIALFLPGCDPGNLCSRSESL